MKLLINRLTHERRMARRYDVRVPLRYRIRQTSAEERTAESENLSSLGILFAQNEHLSVGAAIDVSMHVPAHLEGICSAEWLCTGHVVRVEPSDSGSNRIGIKFDCYEIRNPEVKHVSVRC